MRRKIILRLGTLCILYSYQYIGHYIDGSGIDNSLEIDDHFGSRTVFSVLNCGQGVMKKALATHEITLTALYSIYHKALIHQNSELITEDFINAVRNTLSNCENTKANHDKYQTEDFAREAKAFESKVSAVRLDISVHEDGYSHSSNRLEITTGYSIYQLLKTSALIFAV